MIDHCAARARARGKSLARTGCPDLARVEQRLLVVGRACCARRRTTVDTHDHPAKSCFSSPKICASTPSSARDAIGLREQMFGARQQVSRSRNSVRPTRPTEGASYVYQRESGVPKLPRAFQGGARKLEPGRASGVRLQGLQTSARVGAGRQNHRVLSDQAASQPELMRPHHSITSRGQTSR
jgi:hypothetical protein